jgi:hypothetical protein
VSEEIITLLDSNLGIYEPPWAKWQKAFETKMAEDTTYFRCVVWMPTIPSLGNIIVNFSNFVTNI